MIFLIIIKNSSNRIKVPNKVLGDASRLIPGPFTNLQETKPVGWTWDQFRMILNYKPQASSLTADQGDGRIR